MWFMIAFYVYIALAVFQFLVGVFFLIDQAGVAKAFSCCTMLAKCTQCALWFWALFGLRFSAEGSVATGGMWQECEGENPDLVDIAVVGGGASCNGPFQLKSGKLFLWWLILSFFMCK